MEFKSLSMSEASKKMELWKEDQDSYMKNMIDEDCVTLRDLLVSEYKKIDATKKYNLDYKFGRVLYEILQKNGFTPRDAASDDKWRHLSLCVVPDLVCDRWSVDADVRYYKQGTRIWLRTIWWYIYLSMQNTMEETMEILKDNSTDQILNLVDRIGRKGYYIDTYRIIMKYYYKARCKDPSIGDAKFRKVMTLHTAFCKTIDPDLYPGGAEAYVKMIYEKARVKVDDTN